MNATCNDFIILDNEGFFFSSPGYWSKEYPAAQSFRSAKLAREAVRAYGKRKTATRVMVIKDYGLETERTV